MAGTARGHTREWVEIPFRSPGRGHLESRKHKEMRMDAQRELDTRGLNCPLPILKAKKALAEMSSGEMLKVIATDPGSMRDFQAFARQTGNELIEQSNVADEFIHVLRRR
jgi:TusA-related sulfurtransferase